MKKNDLAAIILIVAIALVASYFLANNFIGSPENTPVEVEVVTPVDDSFPTPDTRVFGEGAIDPTVTITPGSAGSQQPFAQ